MSGDRDAIQEVSDTTKVRTKPCWICGQHSYIFVPYTAWKMFDHLGVPLDIAWPDGSAEDKGLILTGVHPKCWDAEFPDDVPKEK